MAADEGDMFISMPVLLLLFLGDELDELWCEGEDFSGSPPAPVGVVAPLPGPETSLLSPPPALLLFAAAFLAFSWLAASPLPAADAVDDAEGLLAVALLVLDADDEDEEPTQLFIMGELLVPDAPGPLLLSPWPKFEVGEGCCGCLAFLGQPLLAGPAGAGDEDALPAPVVTVAFVVVVGVCEAVVVDARFSSSMASARSQLECCFPGDPSEWR